MTAPIEKPAKLSVIRTVSAHHMRHAEGLPSELLRRFEADLIAELARKAALAGQRFDGWPTIRLDPETDFLRNCWTMRAEVVAK